MEIITVRQGSSQYPERLQNISGPPKVLYVAGQQPLSKLLEQPAVAIVGSRKMSPYGRQVTYDLARQLAERGIVIISGLALGVDAIAHRAALDAGGVTIAVLPTSLHKIYPSSHQPLARRILETGGALVTEYETDDYVFKTNFVARNRIVTGLANVLLVTEAAFGSGSLRTATFAMDQGQTVFAVPGPIYSPGSAGTNGLLKTSVIPATNVIDILHALGITPSTAEKTVRGATPQEQTVLDLLVTGVHDGEALVESSGLDISEFNQVLTMLEISNKVRALGANQWALT